MFSNSGSNSVKKATVEMGKRGGQYKKNKAAKLSPFLDDNEKVLKKMPLAKANLDSLLWKKFPLHFAQLICVLDRNGKKIHKATLTAGCKRLGLWSTGCIHGPFKARIGERTRVDSTRGCRPCSYIKRGDLTRMAAVAKHGSILNTHPQIASEWLYPVGEHLGRVDITPDSCAFNSHLRVKWKCIGDPTGLSEACGHEYEAKISDRTAKKHGCPRCKTFVSGQVKRKKAVVNYGSVQDHPVLNKEFRRILNPDRQHLTSADISLESNYLVEWECSLHPGTLIKASASSRLRAEHEDGSITGCDLCGREKRRISAQERGVERSGTLTQFYPVLAKEWVACIEDPRRTADNTSPGSNLQVKWQCQIHAHHNPWTTTVSSRTAGAECPDCFELRRPNIRRLSVLRQQGSITITHPQIAGEFVRCIHKSEFSANDLSHGSGELCEWMCEIHDKIFEASVHDRTSEIKGCPICGKLRGIKAVMDAALKRSGSLKEMYPEIAKQWVEPVYLEDSHLTPETISPHSNKYIYWKCDKHDQEHIWPSTIGNRTTGYGCPICKSSKGEIATASAMRILGVSFQSEMYVSNLFKKLGLRKPQISGRLSYDFAVFDADGLVAAFVEFHGIHHYEPINFGGSSQTERDVQRAFEEGKERDQIKTTLAKDLVIPQLVIPYWEMNNIEILLVEFFKQIKGVN